ncbi:MAG: helix-turn-helix domain-containing protein [Caulobacteraceae bacterium]
MPLDADPYPNLDEARAADGGARGVAALRPAKSILDPAGAIGPALRVAREQLGLAVEDIASATRVRGAYIAAIERSDLDALPARPFVIGYVRAYARALGLEAEAAVERFRTEAPPAPDDLLAPVGGENHAPRRLRGLAIAAGAIVAALAAWNILRHAEASPKPPSTAVRPTFSARARPASGPAQLGAPLPTPPEASSPAVYRTPGLWLDAPTGEDARRIGVPFVAAGAVYGARAAGPEIILQARKATSLVVRGPSGTVLFARQLAAGEAWRSAPRSDLVADVGNPASIEVFAGGLSRGAMSEARMALSRLAA